eukprot:XP_001693938.1 predicted protein [Chlamydomonas reinhardtii]
MLAPMLALLWALLLVMGPSAPPDKCTGRACLLLVPVWLLPSPHSRAYVQALGFCEGNIHRLGFWDVLYLRPSDKASFDLVKKLFFVGSPGRRTGLLGGSPQFAVNRGMTTTEELWCGAPPPFTDAVIAPPPGHEDQQQSLHSPSLPATRPPPEMLALPTSPALVTGAAPAVQVALAGGNLREGQLRFLWPASAAQLPWTAASPGTPASAGGTDWVWAVACEIDDAVARVACRQLGLNHTGASADGFPITWNSVKVWPAMRVTGPDSLVSNRPLFLGTSGMEANSPVDLLKDYRAGVDPYDDDDDTRSGDVATEAVAGGVYCGAA